jgi:ATP-binding cassette subfamily B protein
MKEKRLPLFGIPKLMKFIWPYRGKLTAMILLGAFSSLADTLFPLFNQYAIDHFIAGKTFAGIGGFLVLYLLLMVLQELDNFYCLYNCGRIEMAIDRDLREAAFNHLQTLSFSYFNQHGVGYIHARVMSDTAKIGDLVAWKMMDVVWNLSYLIFVFIMMLRINARLALYVIALVPVAVVLIVLFNRILEGRNRKIREWNAKITGGFNEGITGAKSIKTLAAEERMTGRFKRDTDRMYRTAVNTAHYAALVTSLVTMLSSAALSIVLWKGGRITMEGIIQIGTLSVFISYAVGILEPVKTIITTFSAMIAIQVNIGRFSRLLDEQSDVADSPEVIEKYGDLFHPKKENWEPLQGSVEFKDVTFRYPDGDVDVLSHFSLKVEKGTNVAIVGETGAGKSTLVNLVCRFYEPTEGQVLIDGKDARCRSQLWLHSGIGYVLQSPHLFSGSVRENLRYGKPDASDEEIWKALRLVSAETIVERMGGLDAEVGEGGGTLSSGEKQLLSFARALLADPKILVLDEATASVDTVTEKRIQDAIAAVIHGRTSFVIAHRLSTIVSADLILAVHDGKIVERGTHHELMKKHGYYYRMYREQIGGALPD